MQHVWSWATELAAEVLDVISSFGGLFRGCVIAAAFSLAAGGCLTSAPPQPKSWVVSAERKSTAELDVSKTARLGALSVAAPYDKSALVVKRSDGSIAFDAYNVFATSPSMLLRMPLLTLLESDGRFGHMLTATSAARSNTTLEAVVTDLSLDCREEGKRVANVSISLVVIENREVKMFLDGIGFDDATSGNYSVAFSDAFSKAVANALESMPTTTAK